MELDSCRKEVALVREARAELQADVEHARAAADEAAARAAAQVVDRTTRLMVDIVNNAFFDRWRIWLHR